MKVSIPKNAKLLSIAYLICIILTWWGLLTGVLGFAGGTRHEAVAIALSGIITGLTGKQVIDMLIWRIDPFEALRLKVKRLFPSKDDETWNETLYRELMTHRRFDVAYILRMCLHHRFVQLTRRRDYTSAHYAMTVFTTLEEIRQTEETYRERGESIPEELLAEHARNLEYLLESIWLRYHDVGIVFDVELQPHTPLTMGHYGPKVKTRLCRWAQAKKS